MEINYLEGATPDYTNPAAELKEFEDARGMNDEFLRGNPGGNILY